MNQRPETTDVDRGPESPVSPLVIEANDALSPRHVSSYLALAFASGAVNAGAFLACERFVSHVTGTVTRIGLDLSAPTLMAEYLAVTVSFIAGAMASVAAIDARAARGRTPRPDLVLHAVGSLLLGVAVVGELGWFGPFGGATEETPDFELLIALSLAMGAMNAAVASSTALSVRTTHMTGPATDVGVQLGRAIVFRGEERRRALGIAGVRGGKIVAFAVGASVTALTAGALTHLVFVAPALVLVGASLRSFTPAERAAPPEPSRLVVI